MPMLDARFERELEIFRTEAEQCAQFLFGFLAVHDVAYRNKEVHKLLNRAPLFWKTCLGALQSSAFIALGRVFDSDSPHNINQLLRLAQHNRTQLFSRSALGRRKQASNSNAHEWLDEFLKTAHEPTADDFRRIRKRVARWRRIYEANYRDVRHQFFAHKQAAEEAEVTALFSRGTNRELQQLIAFLGSLYRALWELPGAPSLRVLCARVGIHEPGTGTIAGTLLNQRASVAPGGFGVRGDDYRCGYAVAGFHL